LGCGSPFEVLSKRKRLLLDSREKKIFVEKEFICLGGTSGYIPVAAELKKYVER